MIDLPHLDQDLGHVHVPDLDPDLPNVQLPGSIRLVVKLASRHHLLGQM